MNFLLYIPFAGLWFLGGQFGFLRDIFVPILAGATLLIKYHAGWPHYLMAGLTVGTFQIIRLGYGSYDPEHDSKPSLLAKLTHDRLGAYIRALYGAIVGLVGLLPFVIITGHIWLYFGYVVILSGTGYLVVKLKTNRLVTDLNIGAAVGNVIII